MRKTSYLAFVAAALSGTAGCTSLMVSRARSATAGQIGCLPGEIAIVDYQYNGMGATWGASCRGKRMVCTYLSDQDQHGHQVSCADEVKAPSPPDKPIP